MGKPTLHYSPKDKSDDVRLIEDVHKQKLLDHIESINATQNGWHSRISKPAWISSSLFFESNFICRRDVGQSGCWCGRVGVVGVVSVTQSERVKKYGQDKITAK